MLNCFKDYNRCINVSYHILENIKFTVGQSHMLHILYCQYHTYWCCGDLRSQGICSHGIDQIIPIITWYSTFLSINTNIPLIISSWTSESREINVRVFMLPCNSRGEYYSCPHPFRDRARAIFRKKNMCHPYTHVKQTFITCQTMTMLSLDMLKSLIFLAHCPFQRMWRDPHGYILSVLEHFRGIAMLVDEGLAFV